MNLAQFKSTSADAAPPSDTTPLLQALWWAAKGDWDKAHAIAQANDTPAAARVHAYLHRVEGDLGNAAYWYRRAGRSPASGALEEEWAAIAETLLEAR